ncbi:MAG: hypothetical protein M3Q76_11895 [Acidobacteriota bacterium]|nr:hypothetical protein [Acidobacteriota bacterium]
MSQVKTAFAHPAVATTTPALKLRELGIYRLADGREFIVSTLYSDGCCLYSNHAWQTFGTAEFWLGTDGQLMNKGLPTCFRVQDLKDTGRTGQYPKATNYIL